ncbi:MAG: MotA/TolQ/ExbB proton channel family protein [Verrucomicrobiota bacterium]
MNELFQTMWHTWMTGGWVMGAMVVLSVVVYVSAAHLLMLAYHRGLTKATDSSLREWVAKPDSCPASVREVIRYSQDEIHSVMDIEGRFREIEATQVTDLDRRIAFLNVLVVSAPLFGLLGTVLGMLLTFKAIGVGGASASEVIAKGISEALVATQTGMMVAIPGLIMASVAKRWRNEYVAFLARLESITLRHFRPEFHGMTRYFVKRPSSTTGNEMPPPAMASSEPVNA